MANQAVGISSGLGIRGSRLMYFASLRRQQQLMKHRLRRLRRERHARHQIARWQFSRNRRHQLRRTGRPFTENRDVGKLGHPSMPGINHFNTSCCTVLAGRRVLASLLFKGGRGRGNIRHVVDLDGSGIPRRWSRTVQHHLSA